ncbi:MAG: 2-oxoacid:acceptor oxidoreductase family protein, partial [Candidatus Thorarchaeota archaeon]
MGNTDINNDISIVLCGAAGQGIQTVEALLTKTLKRTGYHVFATREYMSRVRGGVNSTTIRVSSNLVRAFVDRIDILIPLNEDAIPHLKERISTNTLIIGESEYINAIGEINCQKVEVPFRELSIKLGGKIYANIVSLGVILCMLNVEKKDIHNLISENFGKKGQEILDNNIKAVDKGYEVIEDLISSNKINQKIRIEKDSRVKNDYILTG